MSEQTEPIAVETSGSDRQAESNFMRAAEQQIDRLVKANQRHTRWRWIQGIMIAVLASVVIVLVILFTNQRTQDIRTCNQGNVFRAEQTQIWDEVIALSLPNAKTPAARQEDLSFEKFVEKVDAPRQC